jgi:phage shock protein PspC (stress-responsive transcriptional regulator)
MKKTFTANINGIVFHIDEDAYAKLERYLATIRKHFSSDEGCDEIIAGIEGRIAEVFQDRVSTQKQVITLGDVRDVIDQLGEPEQISDEAELSGGEKKAGEKKQSYEKRYVRDPESEYYGSRASKRLFRDPDDKYIGGVCAGLASYFDIDPVWMRIIFIISLFAGFGVLLYIILWIVVPKASTHAEKLEMRGERVNLSNIEKSIREDLDDIKRNLRNISEETRDAFKKKR